MGFWPSYHLASALKIETGLFHLVIQGEAWKAKQNLTPVGISQCAPGLSFLSHPAVQKTEGTSTSKQTSRGMTLKAPVCVCMSFDWSWR